jgi:hypothetical protein
MSSNPADQNIFITIKNSIEIGLLSLSNLAIYIKKAVLKLKK